MPRKAKQAPTNFQSDDEDDGRIERCRSSPPSPSISDMVDTPSVPKQQPGRLGRVYTLPDDASTPVGTDVNSSRSPGPPPMYKTLEEPARANTVVDLVATLAASNASLKGKVDDTGRFELEFELNPKPANRFGGAPGSSYYDGAPVNKESPPRAKPGRRSIGWSRS